MTGSDLPADRVGSVDPELALALSYAPRARQAALAALLGLDATLGQVLRTTREPLVGQMRLTWWHQALTALDDAPPPAQPVLRALARDVLPQVSGAALAELVEGWEALLEPEALDRARLSAYAQGRGEAVFALAGRVLGAGAGDPLAAAGAGWALADLAGHLRDAAAADAARTMAIAAFAAGTARWSRNGRALGALALSARMTLALPAGTAPPVGAPRRVARLAWLRLTGR